MSHINMISGIRWIATNYLLSVSIDQCLHLWNTSNLKLAATSYLEVTDISDMDVYQIEKYEMFLKSFVVL